MLRSFAALDLGQSMMNFAAVGLSDEDAAAFLKWVFLLLALCLNFEFKLN